MAREKHVPSLAFSLVIKHPQDHLSHSSPEAKKLSSHLLRTLSLMDINDDMKFGLS